VVVVGTIIIVVVVVATDAVQKALKVLKPYLVRAL